MGVAGLLVHPEVKGEGEEVKARSVHWSLKDLILSVRGVREGCNQRRVSG